MGNFISVCTEEPEKIAAIVTSKDHSKIEAEVEANPRIAGDHKVRRCLARLVDGDFPPGAPRWRAVRPCFSGNMRSRPRRQTTVEIHVDEDLFPEFCNFVRGVAEPPQAVPTSEFGSPAAGYWDAVGVSRQILVLEGKFWCSKDWTSPRSNLAASVLSARKSQVSSKC